MKALSVRASQPPRQGRWDSLGRTHTEVISMRVSTSPPYEGLTRLGELRQVAESSTYGERPPREVNSTSLRASPTRSVR